MSINRDSLKGYSAAALMLYAVIGLSPLGGLGCDHAFVWDSDAQEWREATPDDQAEHIHDLAKPVKDALTDTPAAGAIPWLDALTRLAAVLVAFRWSRPPKPKIKDPA